MNQSNSISVLHKAKYSDLIDMIQEAKNCNAFLPLKDDNEVFLDYMRTLEGTSGTHFFKFQSSHIDIGFAVILTHKEKQVLSIGPIYIKKEYQGQGMGKELVKKIISWAKREGLWGLFTKTWSENSRSRTIFEELGFEYAGEKRNDRVDGDSTVHYLLTWN